MHNFFPNSIFLFREIGPRTLVWAEKELVDKSAYEFAEVSEFFDYLDLNDIKSWTSATFI